MGTLKREFLPMMERSDNSWRSSFEIKCSLCGDTAKVSGHSILPDDFIRAKLSKTGWTLGSGKKRDSDKCPTCSGVGRSHQHHEGEIMSQEQQKKSAELSPPLPPNELIFIDLIRQTNASLADIRAALELLVEKSQERPTIIIPENFFGDLKSAIVSSIPTSSPPPSPPAATVEEPAKPLVPTFPEEVYFPGTVTIKFKSGRTADGAGTDPGYYVSADRHYFTNRFGRDFNSAKFSFHEPTGGMVIARSGPGSKGGIANISKNPKRLIFSSTAKWANQIRIKENTAWRIIDHLDGFLLIPKKFGN